MISAVVKDTAQIQAEQHPFISHPHRTLLGLTLPVLLSLVAEPFTALVDTAFVARLGAQPLASLGVAATLMSSFLWVFNFLSIGTQTELARAMGARHATRGREISSLAMLLGVLLGIVVCLVGWPLARPGARLMGLSGDSALQAASYLRIRLLGGPAVLLTVAAFGTLRGLQNMRTPLVVAVVVNALNLALDPLLIFGIGPFPRLELAGAALASTVSQWVGAALVLYAVARKPGLTARLPWTDVGRLLVVGRDLVLRTGALLLFLVLATRAANRLGTEAGAAHQVVRQFWLFSAFLLDAYAVASQSLVGYFVATGDLLRARRVAVVSCAWCVGTGTAVSVAMLLGTQLLADLVVPPQALECFTAAWIVAALSQPVNALSFATDGIHWGTSDYRFLRNGMLVATATGSALLVVLDGVPSFGLTGVWLVVVVWILVRAGFGVTRIWPGLGAAPLRKGLRP